MRSMKLVGSLFDFFRAVFFNPGKSIGGGGHLIDRVKTRRKR